MPFEITIADFIWGVEAGYIHDVFTVTVSGEQRVYGKTSLGQGDAPEGWSLVYAVVP